MSRARNKAVLLAIALAIVATGLATACGSGDEGRTTSTFEIDLPTDADTGTSPAAKPPNPDLPDSETNDLPPEPDSPQEAFEKFCREHPEACG